MHLHTVYKYPWHSFLPFPRGAFQMFITTPSSQTWPHICLEYKQWYGKARDLLLSSCPQLYRILGRGLAKGTGSLLGKQYQKKTGRKSRDGNSRGSWVPQASHASRKRMKLQDLAARASLLQWWLLEVGFPASCGSAGHSFSFPQSSTACLSHLPTLML